MKVYKYWANRRLSQYKLWPCSILVVRNPSEIYSTSSATTISRTKVLHGGKPNLTIGIARMVTNVAQIGDLGENSGNQGQTWFRDWNMSDWNIMNENTCSTRARHAHGIIKTDWTDLLQDWFHWLATTSYIANIQSCTTITRESMCNVS